MSAEPIYLASIVASVESDGDRWRCSLTDEVDEHDDGRLRTRQGPLASGDYRDIGSLRVFLERVLATAGEKLDERRTYVLELVLVAYYASEYLPVGAKRRFSAESDGQAWKFTPETIATEQIRSRRQRRRLTSIVEESLD